jgi:hypothetical protein
MPEQVGKGGAFVMGFHRRSRSHRRSENQQQQQQQQGQQQDQHETGGVGGEDKEEEEEEGEEEEEEQPFLRERFALFNYLYRSCKRVCCCFTKTDQPNRHLV